MRAWSPHSTACFAASAPKRPSYATRAAPSSRRREARALTPRAGDTVVLTINNALQEICERALAGEVAAEGASGGDIVVIDPRDGSILAMASSRRDPRSIEATALTEPFEPGSTIKPFIAASLLARGRATPDDISRHAWRHVRDQRSHVDR